MTRCKKTDKATPVLKLPTKAKKVAFDTAKDSDLPPQDKPETTDEERLMAHHL